MGTAWQVKVEEKDKDKMAFSTLDDLFEINVMTFGLHITKTHEWMWVTVHGPHV